ncbi:2-oxoisovalerate dehydrogenase E1 component beta subunit [Anaerolineae bacterium]|nr:2-oxoisovalerate dehydrogenase E1 component beta subunit [Anaerolineae bacterium]
MPTKTFLESIRDTMHDEMARDERVIVMGEDVGVSGGVFRATEGLHEKFGAERVIDTPLAELSIIGIAIGAAAVGMRPIAEIQFADFIHPAFDQIVNEAAKMRYRSNGGWGCPMVIRTPYGGGIHGGLYHSQSIEAFFCHSPGLIVISPSTPYDAKGLLTAAIRNPDPVLFLEHKKLYRSIKGEVPDDDYVLPIGKADVKRAGSDVTAIAYGAMLHETLNAADTLAREGIEVEVVDLRTLFPLDRATILESVRKTSKVCIIHEDTKTMGLGAEIAAIITEEAFGDLDAPIVRVTGPDLPGIPFNETGEHAFLPNAEKIATALRELARY